MTKRIRFQRKVSFVPPTQHSWNFGEYRQSCYQNFTIGPEFKTLTPGYRDQDQDSASIGLRIKINSLHSTPPGGIDLVNDRWKQNSQETIKFSEVTLTKANIGDGTDSPSLMRSKGTFLWPTSLRGWYIISAYLHLHLHSHSLSPNTCTLCLKKQYAWRLIITSANVDRFSKFFHW